MQTNPAAIRMTPTAKIHPHPRTPQARRSNALTNRETPENKSHSVNRNGSDIMVNHWFSSRNKERMTVNTPSSKSQPEPSMNPLVVANTTISITPDSSINTPIIKPAVMAAMS